LSFQFQPPPVSIRSLRQVELESRLEWLFRGEVVTEKQQSLSDMMEVSQKLQQVGEQQFQQFCLKICDELFSMFGDGQRNFAVKPTDCQVLVSIIIIAKLSFWINKPFLPSVTEALDQYKQKGYVQKLKTQITPDLINSCHQDFVTLLYRQVTHIDG